MADFVNVQAITLESFLKEKGFWRMVQGHEVVYVRRNHQNSCVMVKVYTSMSANAKQARGCGEDAIRVVTAWEGKGRSFGIYKAKKILRVTSEIAIMARLYARMREAYKAGNEWLTRNANNLPR